MTMSTAKPGRILVVADTSESRVALESAIALADMHGAALEVVACVEPPHDLSVLARLSGEAADRLIANAVAHTREAVRERVAEIMPDRPAG